AGALAVHAHDVGLLREAVVDLGDVAKVHDGFAQQANIVRVNGQRASYLVVLKKASASTIAVVDSAPELLPQIQAVAPPGAAPKVHDGFAQQANIVRVTGQRASYLVVLKKASASTIAVVDSARELLPQIQAVAPQGLELKLDFDQSVFVRAAIDGVLREAV